MTTTPAPGQCQFATATEVITPPRPMRLACTGDFASTSTGVHDDQHVRVLALQANGGQVLLWVSYELLFFDRALNRALAEHAHRRYGIDPVHVTVAAVHNHNAGATCGYNPGAATAEYDALLVERGIAAIDTAMAHLRPGTLELRRTDIDLNIQRRVVTDGVATAGPNEGAPRDTELVLLTVTDASTSQDDSATLAACVVVWACHPVFYPELTTLSGEYPARLAQLLATDRYGCTPLFFQGAAGDARPRATIVDGAFARRGFGVIDRFARQVGDEVLALLERPGTPLDLDPTGVEFTVELPLSTLTVSDYQALAASGGPGNPTATNAQLRIDDHASRPEVATLTCTLVKLSGPEPVWLATMSGEPCHDIKELVRAEVPGPVVFIGYTDSTIYVVSDRMIAEGGYEVSSAVSFGHRGPLQPGVDARISAAFRQAVAALT